MWSLSQRLTVSPETGNHEASLLLEGHQDLVREGARSEWPAIVVAPVAAVNFLKDVTLTSAEFLVIVVAQAANRSSSEVPFRFMMPSLFLL